MCILFGYFRFITDENGNVDLNNYRFTGGITLVITGMFDGTYDLITRLRSKNSVSALAVYLGLFLLYIGVVFYK
ncbi:MetJ regulator of methionine regulon [Pseudoalteromonas sp. S979]|nr:MetJ regulator of methionine regulon [Pseudoalteromonadaceae bacterium]OUX91997.1 MAG: MetJ regulator of methionine regulon [Pseudoalteromonas sp. TMED43]TMS67965.1 MetJ regulator of methionine regulon [Pseudoalteromonas sp. S1691]TMS72673.1 MetJ regulator of methionine regulon [Pseudoalteromonas sp. S1731]TMS75145.1 MetJ regulator of methionine regulon [Pseudoalteromonas sp. S1941]TMS77405.1 MetJ regulator of methionine regulon [Pseudoalteromonas sp. S1690]TMS86623.1 MetJ regulator of met